MFASIRRPLMAGLILSAAILVVLAGPAPAQDTAAADSTSAAEAPSSDRVGRAAVCTSVADREPVGEAASFSADVGRLFCFTEIRGLSGTTVTHAWIHDGTTRARVELPVRSDRWRTWSTKQVLEGWTGNWEVKILDADGIVLQTLSFVVE